ncbi:spore cortex biosynthesis protein YabQ [Thermobrachium celere]|uniref:spore cortex biosynthesis protein YabQ n=1 Tax=Thermobrachium celere TaxID=53422 RepID=UPI0005933517|nr:spore cortex biosynthesis protein YabQ [Thermobrachium celere]GFR35645.1 hypothetical protein TCEA9_14570 [Thermobrachium celere]
MTLPIFTQFKYFISTISVGFIIGIFYDFYRICSHDKFRKNILTAISDLLFWILMSIISFIFMVYTNNLNLRYYSFLGIFFGFLIYSKYLSKLFYGILNSILYVIIKLLSLILKIIYLPLKFALVILRSFVYYLLNFRRKN